MPDALREHVPLRQRLPDRTVAVLGYTTLHPDVGKYPLMQYVTAIDGRLFSCRNVNEGTFYSFDMYWGGRTSSKRDFLLAHGGFNSVFRFGCKDIELGYRMAKHELRVLSNRRAQCITIRNITFEAFCQKLWRKDHSQHTFWGNQAPAVPQARAT